MSLDFSTSSATAYKANAYAFALASSTLSPVGHRTWNGWNISDPAPVSLAVNFKLESQFAAPHARRWFPVGHDIKMRSQQLKCTLLE
jgi:hypothetical protein